MAQPTFPLTIASYWGSDPNKSDEAEPLTFASQATYNAFMTGVNEADGWFEAAFVDHANYRVNRAGEIISAPPKNTPEPTQCFVLWGEEPEAGSSAQTYNFDTIDEAAAFQEGVEHMVGWSKYFFVPSEEFKAYYDLNEAMSHLSEDGLKALAAYMDDNELDGVDGPYFVRHDGSFVDGDWSIGETIYNELLSQAEWNARFDEQLKSVYGITVQDAGLDSSDLANCREGFERDVARAVETYGTKQDLAPVKTNTFGL